MMENDLNVEQKLMSEITSIILCTFNEVGFIEDSIIK